MSYNEVDMSRKNTYNNIDESNYNSIINQKESKCVFTKILHDLMNIHKIANGL